jgi:hypothetical protein
LQLKTFKALKAFEECENPNWVSMLSPLKWVMVSKQGFDYEDAF